ncbi:hypothetical protein [Aestuariibaculum sediminum]|uniref:Uncharacterized protein n=1 Tax=Aestuariibaculum sediminum TaxID=2770637 RepID=A0A8J6U879_9FLAO|nr:hypothetical protein [Aestuariibaculum sediminum]MBD0831032.1 hypothetical protein [Aestuariibaculum sediminum]
MEKKINHLHWNFDHLKKDPEKQFFLLTGLWFFFVTLAGFADSFYLKTSITPNPGFLIVHGITFSIWVILFLVQCVLISSKNIIWHMRLGKFGVILLFLVFVTGFHTIINSAHVRSHEVKEGTLMQILLGVSIALIAIYNRKKPYIHKRIMVLAMVFLTVAAVQRLARTFWNFEDNFWLINVLYIVPLLAMTVFDQFYFKKFKFLSLLILIYWLTDHFLLTRVYTHFFDSYTGKRIIEMLQHIFLVL